MTVWEMAELVGDQGSDDLLEEILPLTSFALRDDEQRAAFLCEFCKAGEPALFEAVNHIWSSLEEPRDARCIAIGMKAGTGGRGKLALVHVLRGCLKEVIGWGEQLPRSSDYSTLDDWHRATMTAFEAEWARECEVYKRYASILNGEIY